METPMNTLEPTGTIPGYPFIVTNEWVKWKSENLPVSKYPNYGLLLGEMENKLTSHITEELGKFEFHKKRFIQYGDEDYYVLVITGKSNKVLIEPTKTLPNRPNTITMVWLLWKGQQEPENSISVILKREALAIAKTLPGYINDDEVSTKVVGLVNADLIEGHATVINNPYFNSPRPVLLGLHKPN